MLSSEALSPTNEGISSTALHLPQHLCLSGAHLRLRYPPPHDVHAFPLHQRLSCSPKWILSHLQHVSSQYDVLSAPLTLFTSVNQAVCSAKLHISPCFPDTRLPRVVALCTNCQLYTKFAPLPFPLNSCKLPPPSSSSLFPYPPFVA
jgi:hypothetical protein